MKTDFLKGGDDAKAAHASPLRRHEHIAQVKPPVTHAGTMRHIDRFGQLLDQRQRRGHRGRRVVPHGDVKRLGRDILLGQVRYALLEPGRDGRHQAHVGQADVDETLERLDERLGLLRRDVDVKRLDGEEAILLGVVGAKDWPENTNADLMHDPKRSECTRSAQ